MRTDIARLRDQVNSLNTTNEEATRRIAGADAEKLQLEHESAEKDRQLLERDEQIKHAQESGTKLRKALHKMKETITSNEQTHIQELGQ